MNRKKLLTKIIFANELHNFEKGEKKFLKKN